MLLALDTATTWSSVAVLADGECLAADELTGRNPGEVTVGQVDRLLAGIGASRGELTAVAVGVGPGPYTSTRVGVAIARALGYGLGVEVLGVCSQDAVAAQFAAITGADPAGPDLVVATDARRREIYWARYAATGARLAGPAVGAPAEVIAEQDCRLWLGDGLDRYPDLAQAADLRVGDVGWPSAEWVGRIAVAARSAGESVPAEQPGLVAHGDAVAAIDPAQRLFGPFPLYLRRPDAVPPVSAAAR